MGVKVLQGTLTGLIISILTGMILGFFNLGFEFVAIMVLTVLTYIPAGFVAARGIQHPFLAASMAGFILFILNQTFTAINFGLSEPGTVVLGLLVGLLVPMIGALVAYLLNLKEKNI